MDTETKIKEMIVKLLGLRSSNIDTGAKLYEGIGVDSTEMVEIRIALEKAFGVKLDEKEISKFQSIKDISGIIDSKPKPTPGVG